MLAKSINFFLLIATALFLFKIINSQCNGTPKDISVGYKPGVLKYPESGEYNTSLVCEWLLTSNVSGTILYKSTDILIDCSDSYNIYDGQSASSPAKETGICTSGSTSLSKTLDRSSGQYLFLRFISDGNAAQGKDKGFTIHFVSSEDLSSCASSGTSTSVNATNVEQAFTSPLFPNTYLLNHQCTWTISPSTPDATVTLRVYYIDIDSSGGTCYDKLTINYGTNTDEICGDENFSPGNTYTNGGSESITVTFTSDGLQVESGFVAVYVETETRTTTPTTDTLTTENTTFTAISDSSTLSSIAQNLTTDNASSLPPSERNEPGTNIGVVVGSTIGVGVLLVGGIALGLCLHKYIMKPSANQTSPANDNNKGSKSEKSP